MDFFIKKGTEEFRNLLSKNGLKFKDDNFYVLMTNKGVMGYVTFEIMGGYITIRNIKVNIDDDVMYDALLRAVAFYGTERMVQYVIYSGEDSLERKKMLKSIFNEWEDNKLINSIYDAQNISKTKGIYVDGIKLFSGGCASEKRE